MEESNLDETGRSESSFTDKDDLAKTDATVAQQVAESMKFSYEYHQQTLAVAIMEAAKKYIKRFTK